MSTAAPPKPTGNAYEFARPLGQCNVSHRAIAPGEKFMAALRETAGGFERIDVSTECWQTFDRANLLAFWQAVMPRAEHRKKLFVDDSVLCDLFERLSEVTEPAKINFRFVLALILMRKRFVICDSTRQENGREIWTVRLKGRDAALELVNPKLDEQQMQEVSQQLGQILSQEL